jgi:hypothetical protein
MKRGYQWIAAGATVLLAVLVLAGCDYPPFDQAISMGLRTARRLTLESTVGPLPGIDSWMARNHHFRFIPQRGDLAAGYFVMEDDFGARAVYLAINGEFYDVGGLSVDISDKTRPNYRAQPIGDGSFLAVVDLNGRFMDVYRFNAGFVERLGEPPAAFDLNMLHFGPLPISTPEVMSAAFCPHPDPLQETIHFLVKNQAMPEDYYEISWQIRGDMVGLFNPNPFRLGPIRMEEELFDTVYYYHHPTSRTAVISMYNEEAGEYVAYIWDENDFSTTAYFPRRLPVTRRIVAVLTTGDILTEEDGRAYVYDPSGTELYSFPLGDLHFVYELYDPDRLQYRMIFTLPYLTAEDNGWWSLSFFVYSIPTADLETLRR